MRPFSADPARREGTAILLEADGLVLVAGPAHGLPAWPLSAWPYQHDLLPPGAIARSRDPALLDLGDLPRPPGSPDCPTAEELRRALARATGPAAMAALVGIAHLGRRTAQRLAARGLPALLPGIPFHLDIPGPHATLPVLLMQHSAGIPLLDAPAAEHLPYAALLEAIRVRIHGRLLPPAAPHLLFSSDLSAHERLDAARQADRLEAARAAHPDPDAFVSAVLGSGDPP